MTYLNCVTLDAQFESQKFSECALLKEHLNTITLKKGDLFLADRGYSSNALMYELAQTNVEFCRHWKEVSDFAMRSEKSRIVQLKLARKDKRLLDKYNSTEQYITCRLVAVELDTGEKEILCTSLLDEDKFTEEEIQNLYHLRWGIEETYKL